MTREQDQPDRYFFIHIQKTAGTSLRKHLLANFPSDEIYPPAQQGGMKNFLTTYLSGGLLVALPPEIQGRFRLFHGHMPYTVSQRLSFDRPLKTFTILREPVERTISVLGQKKRHQRGLAGASLEEIYDDPRFFSGQILNHQAKIFAVPDDSDLLAGFSPYPVGEQQLAVAKENLARVDVIGLQSDMPAFLADLARTFGWKVLDEDVRENVGAGAFEPIPQRLRDRIAEENRMDMEFYEYALDLVARRATQRQGE